MESDTVDNITKQNGLLQVIRELAHILDSTLSCIYFTFTPQPNLISESGVHPSLNPNCHHQIVYATILQIYWNLAKILTYKFISVDLIYEKFGTAKFEV